MQAPQRCLVTGGAGFVGAAVVRALLADGHHVRVLARPTSDLRNLNGLDVELAMGDLLDEKSVALATRDCNVVYHVAALYSSRAADESALYAINVEGTKTVLQAAANAGVTRVVHTSTIGVIGRPQNRHELPTENTPFNLAETASHYVRSKFLAEQLALEFAAAGVPIVIVNPTAPIGRGDWRPGPTGARIVTYLRGEQPNYLSGGINFCGVDDIARGHVLAAARGNVGERYILGHPNGNLLRNDFLEMMQAVSGQPIPQISSARRWFDPRRWLEKPQISAPDTRPLALTGNPSKAMAALDWQPGLLLDAFREAVTWFRASGMLARS